MLYVELPTPKHSDADKPLAMEEPAGVGEPG
jgi:hypothetical protein